MPRIDGFPSLPGCTLDPSMPSLLLRPFVTIPVQSWSKFSIFKRLAVPSAAHSSHRLWEWTHTCENVSTSLLGSHNPRGIQGREAKCIRDYWSLTHSVPPRSLLGLYILGLAPSTSCAFPRLTTAAQTIPDPSYAGPHLHVTSSLGFSGWKTSEEMDVHLREVPTTCGRNESGKGDEPLGPPAKYREGHFDICLQVLHQWITAAGSSQDSLYGDLRIFEENQANSPFFMYFLFFSWLTSVRLCLPSWVPTVMAHCTGSTSGCVKSEGVRSCALF